MKISIIYFSLSERTKTLSEMIKEELENNKLDVDISRIETKEVGSFLKNCLDAFQQKKVVLESIPDIKEAELLFLCSPIWAFDIVPAMRAFIELSDMKDKKVFLILTYGSGKGMGRAMNNFTTLVQSKGAEVVNKAFIKGRKVKEEFPNIQGEIEECLK